MNIYEKYREPNFIPEKNLLGFKKNKDIKGKYNLKTENNTNISIEAIKIRDLSNIDKKLMNQINKKNYILIEGTDIAIKVRDIAKHLKINSKHIQKELKNEKIIDKNLFQFIEEIKNKEIINEEEIENINFINNIKIENENEFKLTPEEIEIFKGFYIKNLKKLRKLTEPMHIRKTDENGLPRSLLFIPNGPEKGIYVLLKTKRKMSEIGFGSFNRATLVLHLDSGKKKVFRTAKSTDIQNSELETNKFLSSQPEYFSTGIPILYRGSWMERSGRTIGEGKDRIDNRFDQIKDIPKIGFLMDYMENGSLDAKNIKKENILPLCKKIAEGLKVLHQLQLAHLDLKPNNIFLTKEGNPKIADFGFTKSVGSKNIPAGTPQYVAPEIWKCVKQHILYECSPAADIWALGGILAHFAEKKDRDSSFWWDYRKIEFEEKRNKYLPNKDNPKNLDYVIDKCLTVNPAQRPSAADVIEMLNNVYRT